MTRNRYVVIKVAYDRQPTFGRSLEWIAPELRDAGLKLLEDENDGLKPSRTWAGIVDEATFEPFADAWNLETEARPRARGLGPSTGDPQRQPAERPYIFDGMNWEVDGVSPIVYVSIQVTVLPSYQPRSKSPVTI